LITLLLRINNTTLPIVIRQQYGQYKMTFRWMYRWPSHLYPS